MKKRKRDRLIKRAESAPPESKPTEPPPTRLLSQIASVISNRRTKPSSEYSSTGRKVKAWLWALLVFAAGAVCGPLIQEQVASFLPAPRMIMRLRPAERITNLGGPPCNFYRLEFSSMDPLDYAFLKIQFPFPITSFIIGSPPQVLAKDGSSHRNYLWGKDWNEQRQCFVASNDLRPNSFFETYKNSNEISLRSSARLSGTWQIIGVFATTEPLSEIEALPLITQGEYQFSKYGLTTKRELKVDLNVYDP